LIFIGGWNRWGGNVVSGVPNSYSYNPVLDISEGATFSFTSTIPNEYGNISYFILPEAISQFVF